MCTGWGRSQAHEFIPSYRQDRYLIVSCSVIAHTQNAEFRSKNFVWLAHSHIPPAPVFPWYTLTLSYINADWPREWISSNDHNLTSRFYMAWEMSLQHLLIVQCLSWFIKRSQSPLILRIILLNLIIFEFHTVLLVSLKQIDRKL